MFRKKKGITPVIAIVLLLLITVGAVMVVYEQFNNIADNSNTNDKLDRINRLQNANLEIIGAEKYTANIDGTAQDAIMVKIRNNGDQGFNLSAVDVLVGLNGGQPKSIDNIGDGCSMGYVDAGSIATCETGVAWDNPNDGKSTELVVEVDDVQKSSYSCTADGTNYC